MNTYLESVDSEWFNQRLTGVLIFVLIAFAILIFRLLHLQVIEGKEYRRLSEINSIRLQDNDAPRGLILDRNEKTLVDNRPAFNLYVIPKDAKLLDQTMIKLGRFLDEPAEQLLEKIRTEKRRGDYTPVLLKKDISRDTLAAIEVHKFDLPGVVVRIFPKRHYLYQQTGAHVIGYLGEISAKDLQCQEFADCKGGDYIGKFGIEKAYGKILRGKRGGRQVEVNATGQVVRVLKTVDAHAGQNIVLTIDQPLQTVTESLLAGKAGAAVALDPNNGEVLAMASSPSFDPNLFATGLTYEQWNDLISNPFRPLENKAIQAEYPPASTYKIVTTIAGLEEGVIDSHTTHMCPGFYRYGNRVYRCWKRGGHGEVDIIKALAESCDVFFYQVGEALGVDRLAWYARACGLGTLAGINLDRESNGLVPTAAWKQRRIGEPWQGGETLSVAIGQGYNLVTPLQMAVLAAAVGNGGTRFQPHLIKKIIAPEQKVIFKNKPKVMGRLPLKASTLALLHQGLWSVVNDKKGTAWQSRIKELDFSGKTGTAQVVSRRSDNDEEQRDENQAELLKDHAWFVAYAPSVKPSIAVTVIIEHGEHGSSAAAPIASQMIQTYLMSAAKDIITD